MEYISRQLGGPRIQGFIKAIEKYFNTYYTPIIDYFTTLSIDTANEAHTEMIGALIGFPRPLVQKELFMSGLFKFTLNYYESEDEGFSYDYNSTTLGGTFSDNTDYESLTYMDLATYKKVLRILALAKAKGQRYSFTLMDEICDAFAGGSDYTFTWKNGNQDIEIAFATIKSYNLYLVGYVLNFLYDTSPSITVLKVNE